MLKDKLNNATVRKRLGFQPVYIIPFALYIFFVISKQSQYTQGKNDVSAIFGHKYNDEIC